VPKYYTRELRVGGTTGTTNRFTYDESRKSASGHHERLHRNSGELGKHERRGVHRRVVVPKRL